MSCAPAAHVRLRWCQGYRRPGTWRRAGAESNLATNHAGPRVGAPFPTRAGRRSHMGGSADSSTPSASTPHVSRWLGWCHYRQRGCVGGRPRLEGTPVVDETVTAGRERTIRWSRSSSAARPPDSCLVAYVTCCRPVREARGASRKAPTESVVLQPAHRSTAAHGMPLRFPMVNPRVFEQTCSANLRLTNARAPGSRANPVNSRLAGGAPGFRLHGLGFSGEPRARCPEAPRNVGGRT